MSIKTEEKILDIMRCIGYEVINNKKITRKNILDFAKIKFALSEHELKSIDYKKIISDEILRMKAEYNSDNEPLQIPLNIPLQIPLNIPLNIPSKIHDYKKYILESLTILKDNANKDKKIFQTRAYIKVIYNINKIKEPITSYKQVENVEGAGAKIKLKLKEIFDSGVLKEAEAMRDKIRNISSENIYNELLLIYGVGPAKAKNLIEEHEVTSINDLRIKSKKDNKLLTSSQKIGLLCYEDLKERIPRAEMLIHEKILNIPENKGQIVGSFRRKCESSGDIDVMLNMDIDEFERYITHLKSINYLKYILAKGDKKLLGVCQIENEKYRRIDLIRNSPEEYPFMKLYFTGSDKFNIAFRSFCLKKGLSLNEHGFTPKVDGLFTEKDIFDYVGLKYIKPENRIDSNSIQLKK